MAQGKHRKETSKPSLSSKALLFLALVPLALIAAGVYFWAPLPGQADRSPRLTEAEAEENLDPLLPEALPATYGATEATLCAPFTALDVTCSATFTIDETAPVGMLTAQEPAAGERSTAVELTYSKGPARVTVPILSGLPKNEAQELIWAAGLAPGKLTSKDAPITEGLVIDSSLEPSTKVSNGSTIDLTYSTGKITVPTWLGKTQELVEAEAKEFGVRVIFRERTSTETAGTVLVQSSAGKRIPFEREVIIVIAKPEASEATALPDVVGMKQDEAISLLASQGFLKITTVVERKKGAAEEIIAMSPEAGEEVDASTEIVLTVQKSS